MEQRRCSDEKNTVIRHTPNTLTITGISFAFVISAISLVFTFGQQKEKITALECSSKEVTIKLDRVSEKVDNLSGKMDILIRSSRENQ
jgi:hypothetical protein